MGDERHMDTLSRKKTPTPAPSVPQLIGARRWLIVAVTIILICAATVGLIRPVWLSLDTVDAFRVSFLTTSHPPARVASAAALARIQMASPGLFTPQGERVIRPRVGSSDSNTPVPYVSVDSRTQYSNHRCAVPLRHQVNSPTFATSRLHSFPHQVATGFMAVPEAYDEITDIRFNSSSDVWRPFVRAHYRAHNPRWQVLCRVPNFIWPIARNILVTLCLAACLWGFEERERDVYVRMYCLCVCSYACTGKVRLVDIRTSSRTFCFSKTSRLVPNPTSGNFWVSR